MICREKLFEEIRGVLTVHDLVSVTKKSLEILTKEKDPWGAYTVAELLLEFKGIMGSTFFQELNVIPDADFYMATAFHQFLSLAERGRSDAARQVAHYYLNGLCPVKPDRNQYVKWLRRAAELGDQISAAEVKDGFVDAVNP
jgi:TPR repeat protein